MVFRIAKIIGHKTLEKLSEETGEEIIMIKTKID